MTVTAIPYRTKGLDHVVLRAKDKNPTVDLSENNDLAPHAVS